MLRFKNKTKLIKREQHESTKIMNLFVPINLNKPRKKLVIKRSSKIEEYDSNGGRKRDYDELGNAII